MKPRSILPAIGFAFAAVVAFAAFAAASSYGLCVCDDYDYVKASFVAGGFSWQGVLTAFAYADESIWMPLTYLTYMADHAFGWGTGGMHLQGMVIHALNAGVLFLLLVRLVGILSPSHGKWSCSLLCLIAALLWAVHPLRVESVVWIASRKDEISTFFFLWALWVWVGGTGVRRAVAACAVLLAGALAKPSVMVFPAFALPLDFLVTRKQKPMAAYAIMIGISVVIALEGSLAQGSALDYSAAIPFWYRLVNAVAATTVYLGNTVLPTHLAPQCLLRYPAWPRFSLVGAVLLALSAAFVLRLAIERARRFKVSQDWRTWFDGEERENVVVAALFMFFVSIVPFVGIIGFGYHAFADRFTILPSLAFSIGLLCLCAKFPAVRWPWFVGGALAVAGLFAFCRTQVGYWENDGRLFEHTIAVDGAANDSAQRSAGIYYWNFERNLPKAYEHLKALVDMTAGTDDPNDMMSCCHLLVDAAYGLGKDDEAEDYYYLMSKWNHRIGGGSVEFQMAEGLYYANQPGKMDQAEQILARLETRHPNIYETRYLRYYLALKKGDGAAIRKALANCYVEGESEDIYSRNDWAKSKMPAAQLNDLWEKRNESLRQMGVKLVPMPE